MASRFPASWLDELYARADIVQVVSSYVQLKKEGQRYWGLCPFHHEKTPSFSVNAERNLYYCFGCKAGGNVVSFVMEMEKVPFREAAERIADMCRLPLPQMVEDPDYEARKSQKDRLLEANRLAAKYYHELLWTDTGKSVRDYFYGRGLDDRVIRKFGLGASPDDWGKLTEHLMSQGFTEEELVLGGLSKTKETSRYDFFRGRAMFPIINQYGNVLAFGGRTLGDAKPKYLNTGDTPVFNKRLGVYAANLLAKARGLKRVLLVEGYMDVVSLTQAGVEGVVATLGTSLTIEQARYLKKFAPEIWVAYDGDNAGQMAIERALGIFEEENIPARVLFFPGNLDPDEYIRKEGIDAFDQLKPLKSVEYRLMRLEGQFDMSTEDGRVQYAKKSADILSKVQNPVEVEVYLKQIMLKTGFEKNVLLAQIGVSRQNAPQTGQTAQPVQLRRVRSDGQALEGTKAEQFLVSLLAAGILPDGMVKPDDFRDEILKSFVEKLLSGETPASIIGQVETEREKEIAVKVFMIDMGDKPENSVSIAADCLNSLRVGRINEKIDALKLQMLQTQDPAVKTDCLKQIMQLNQEMNRLKQPGHRTNREG